MGGPLANAETSIHDTLLCHPHIVNQYYVQRTESWFQIVLCYGIEVEDYWYRFEFAKSRGAIHFHSLLWSLAKARPLHGCLDPLAQASSVSEFESALNGSQSDDEEIDDDDGDDDGDGNDHQEVAQALESVLPTIFPAISALHPAGLARENPEIPCTTPCTTPSTSG